MWDRHDDGQFVVAGVHDELARAYASSKELLDLAAVDASNGVKGRAGT